MTDIFYDGPLFKRIFPELKSAQDSFVKLQWNIAKQYIRMQPDALDGLKVSNYMALTAHLVKLNLLAQMGIKIDGLTAPVLTAPQDRKGFKSWLEQTSYGRSLG